jgi:hypothetical protein
MSESAGVVVAALVFVAVSLLATYLWKATGRQVIDIPLYRRYGEQILSGALPYRDVAVEYPPGAIVSFLPAAAVTSTPDAHFWVFSGLMAVLGAAGVLLLARLLRAAGGSGLRVLGPLRLVALAPAALGGVVLTRFDLLPTLLVSIALLLLVRGRDRGGFLVLGAAIAVKLYPVVMLPVAAAWVCQRHGRRRALGRALEALAVPAVAYTAFAIVSLDGVAESIWRQLSRPLQIESLGAGVLLALHHLASLPLEWKGSHGSQNLVGAAPLAVGVITTLAEVGMLGYVWWQAGRRPLTTERMLLLSVSAVTVFVAFGKVLSPQFVLWLVFLVPLVGGRRGRRAGAALTVACVLTALWFPAGYWDLVKQFDPLMSFLVLARGLALASLAVLLLLPAEDERAARDTARKPARSLLPVR